MLGKNGCEHRCKVIEKRSDNVDKNEMNIQVRLFSPQHFTQTER